MFCLVYPWTNFILRLICSESENLLFHTEGKQFSGMEFVKFSVFFLFCNVVFSSIALNNTQIVEYSYLKQQIINVCSEFFDRSFCLWSPPEYNDLKSFILIECSSHIPVLQFTSEERVINQCGKVLLVEANQFNVCKMILQNRVPQVVSIVVLTEKSFDLFLKESKECTSLFDSMNVVIISIPNGEMLLLDSTVSSMHYFVNGGMIRRNGKVIIPDFRGKLVKVATFTFPPFSIVRNETGSVEYLGIEMSLFGKLAGYLNFSWELVPLESPGRFGQVLDNGTVVGGVAQALRDGAADIGFCNLWQRLQYLGSMDYGPALNMIYVTFIVRRPHQLLDQWQSLFMIFTAHVWLTIVTTFAALTVVYWRACNIVPGSERKQSLVECAVVLFGILTVSSSHSVPVCVTSRLLTLWAFAFALLLTTAVTSCIVTRLTLPLYSARVDSVEQLVRGGYYWTSPSYNENKQFIREFFFDMNNEHHITFESRYKYVPPERLESVVLNDRNVVLPVQRWGQEHVLVDIRGINLSTDLSDFRVMRGYSQIAFTAFGYRRYSGYNEAFNRVFQSFIEFGLWEQQKHKLTFMRVNRKNLLEEEDEHDFSHLQRLALINLYPAFVLLLIGHCVASVALTIEIVYSNLCRVFD